MTKYKSKATAAQVEYAKKAAALVAANSTAVTDDGAPLVSDKLLSRTEVLAIVGVTYPTLWWWVREAHFPAPRVLGFKKSKGNKGGRIAWLESEVQAWIASRPKRFPKGTKLTEVA